MERTDSRTCIRTTYLVAVLVLMLTAPGFTPVFSYLRLLAGAFTYEVQMFGGGEITYPADFVEEQMILLGEILSLNMLSTWLVA